MTRYTWEAPVPGQIEITWGGFEMTEREKLIEGLKICTDEDGCKTCLDCPYHGSTYESCGRKLSLDAIEALQEDMDRIEELKNRVYNLRLYLTEVRDRYPDLFHFLEERHEGLPGFLPEEDE